MTIPKRLGICMDHSAAHLIEFANNTNETSTLVSKFTHESKENTLSKSEHLMHNKEQHQQAEYYKNLGETIRNYDEVLLFGPTNAKSELLNLLKEDHNFADIKIVVKNADKMSDGEQHTFVKEYFSKSIG